jgi:hypothetical protein
MPNTGDDESGTDGENGDRDADDGTGETDDVDSETDDAGEDVDSETDDDAGEDDTLVDQITRPLWHVIRDVGLAVAQGQHELDDELLDTYRAHAAEGGPDLETPWYRFAEVEVDLELHFHTVGEFDPPPPDTPRVAYEGGTKPLQYGLVAAPATPPDAAFSETERSGSSRIRFRIVPVAPPTRSGDGARSGPRTDGGSAKTETSEERRWGRDGVR